MEKRGSQLPIRRELPPAQPQENIGEVFLWVDTVAAAALDEGVDDGAAPTGVRMPDKQPAALSHGRRPHVILNNI